VLDREVIDEYRRYGYCVIVTFGVVRERALGIGDADVRDYYRRLESESRVLRSFSPYDEGAEPVPFAATIYRLRECRQRYGAPAVQIPRAREE
jgi:hypothetical protein